MAFLVRIEGCNFAATAYDTDDLSTIRGASLAYLRIAETWATRLAHLGKVENIVVGASDAILRVDTTKKREDVEAAMTAAMKAAIPPSDDLDATHPHLTFSFAVIAETADYKKDVAHLLAICRRQQLQQPTVDIPPRSPAAREPCPYDRIRAADTPHYNQAGDEILVSASVAARRTYGRTARSAFYARELAGFDYGQGLHDDYSQSFADMLIEAVLGDDNDHRLRRLPPALSGKHAVIYLDGNSFTKIRDTVIFTQRDGDTHATVSKRHHDFAEAVRAARRKMLANLLKHLASDPLMLFERKHWDERTKTRESRRHLKFETLLWGGDEALFVLPAWKVMDVLPVLAAALDDESWRLPATLDSKRHKLSHAVGLVICSVKTPIAITRALAGEVADASKPLAKKDGKLELLSTALLNVYATQILESVEPPRADLSAFRRELYGTDEAAAFTLVEKKGVAGFVDAMRALQADDGGLPRSQLFKLLQGARKQGLLAAGKATGAAKFLADGTERGTVSDACKRSGCKHFDLLTSPALGYTAAAPLVPLMRLAEMWDYVEPFDGPAASDAALEAAAS